jgi:G:T-mismatch repair DNA endonuclease (very short patch repair protein)
MARLSVGHNAEYWLAKVQRNVERDREQSDALKALGWHVLRFWETDILRDAGRIADQIISVLAISTEAALRCDNARVRDHA